jgi:outer membrane protein assembly factor BamB
MERYGTRNLSKVWYAGQCPLIDNGQAIIAPAGTEVLMMAVACDSGKVTWTVPNDASWKMSHASIVPVTIDGTKQYVYAAVGGVVGVGAEGESAGTILWKTDAWSASVVMPTPVPMSDGRLFLTSGYSGGCAVLQVAREDGAFSVKTLYNFRGKKNYRKCFSCYQQTPIYYQEHLFGIQLNDAKEHRMEFVCVDPNEPGGRFVWFSGKETVLTAPKKKEAWSPYILADDKFYVMGDAGLLVIFEATTARCSKLGQWQLLEGHEVWGPLAIAGGRLLVRDVDHLLCFDIRARSGE